MPQNQKPAPIIQKRPLGSRQGLQRAQKLNAAIRAKKVAAANVVRGPLMSDMTGKRGRTQSAPAQSAQAQPQQAQHQTQSVQPKIVPRRPIARTEFEQRVLAQRRERAKRGGAVASGAVTDTSVLRPQVAKVKATHTRAVVETVQTEVATPQPPVRRPLQRPPAQVQRPAAQTQRPPAQAQRPLKRPVMTPEIEQRPLGQPRYDHLPADATVGDALGATYQDFDPAEPDLPTDAELEAEIAPAPPQKRSPFLESVQVEKRPLSRRLYHDENLPNTVLEDFPADDPELEPPATEPEPRKRSVLPLIGLLALTIVLGAVVGAVVYLCIFQQF